MNTERAVMERPKAELVAPAVTQDQITLIKNTVAKDATDAELQLFMYDCARQGVHPLDRLIHFTKRKGKYTPITSIDFMRARAAETGAHAGTDDALHVGEPKTDTFAATVTVYRLVEGGRYAFTGTARWSEYKPDEAFMWHRMPHTMLDKCAEALALRKGFPRQLAGLYIAEEMEQADRADTPDRPILEAAPFAPDPDEPPAPEGFVRVMLIEERPTQNKHVTKYLITLSTGETVSTINQLLASVAKDARDKRTPMRAETKDSKYGTDLVSLKPAEDPKPAAADPARQPAHEPTPAAPIVPLAADDIPF